MGKKFIFLSSNPAQIINDTKPQAPANLWLMELHIAFHPSIWRPVTICIMTCHTLQILSGCLGKIIYCLWEESINGKGPASCPGASSCTPWGNGPVWGKSKHVVSLCWLASHLCTPSFICFSSHKVIQTPSDFLASCDKATWMNWLRVFPTHAEWEGNGEKCTILVRQRE